MKKFLSLVILIIAIFLCACSSHSKIDLWENATFTEDTVLGNGSKTITVEVTAKEKSITFTIKTDKETVGDALKEHNLISGEEGAYGLYVKKVNGIETAKRKATGLFAKAAKACLRELTGQSLKTEIPTGLYGLNNDGYKKRTF